MALLDISERWMVLGEKVCQPFACLNRDNKGFLLPCLSSPLWERFHTSFLRLRSLMLE